MAKKTMGFYVTNSSGAGMEWFYANSNNSAGFYFARSTTLFPTRSKAQTKIKISRMNGGDINYRIKRLTEID